MWHAWKKDEEQRNLTNPNFLNEHLLAWLWLYTLMTNSHKMSKEFWVTITIHGLDWTGHCASSNLSDGSLLVLESCTSICRSNIVAVVTYLNCIMNVIHLNINLTRFFEGLNLWCCVFEDILDFTLQFGGILQQYFKESYFLNSRTLMNLSTCLNTSQLYRYQQ